MKKIAYLYEDNKFTKNEADEYENTQAHGKKFFQFDDLNSAKLTWSHKGNTKFYRFDNPEREFKDPWKITGKTEWHLKYQSISPLINIEVRIIKDEKIHIADIKRDDGIVIEIQHSYISEEDIRSREEFYENMFWIVDFTKFSDYDIKYLGNNYYKVFNKSHPWVSNIIKPIYLDLGNGIAKIVAKDSLNINTYICKFETYEDFIRREIPLRKNINDFTKFEVIKRFYSNIPVKSHFIDLLGENVIFINSNEIIYIEHKNQQKRINIKDISASERELFKIYNDLSEIKRLFIYNIGDIINKKIICINSNGNIQNFYNKQIKCSVTLETPIHQLENLIPNNLYLELEELKKQKLKEIEDLNKEQNLKYLSNIIIEYQQKIESIKFIEINYEITSEQIKNYLKENQLELSVDIFPSKAEKFINFISDNKINENELDEFFELNKNVKINKYSNQYNNGLIKKYQEQILYIKNKIENFNTEYFTEITEEIIKNENNIEKENKDFIYNLTVIKNIYKDDILFFKFELRRKNKETIIDQKEKDFLIERFYMNFNGFDDDYQIENNMKEIYFVNFICFEILKYCKIYDEYEKNFLEDKKSSSYQLTDKQKNYFWKIYTKYEKERIQVIIKEIIEKVEKIGINKTDFNVDGYETIKKLATNENILTRGEIYEMNAIYYSCYDNFEKETILDINFGFLRKLIDDRKTKITKKKYTNVRSPKPNMVFDNPKTINCL